MNAHNSSISQKNSILYVLPRLQKNIRFDFDDELKIEDVRYDDMT